MAAVSALEAKTRLGNLLDTYIALFDPRHVDPSTVFSPAWDNHLSGQVSTWTVGDVRLLGIVDELEREGWLLDLYRARRILRWGTRLYETPEFFHWKDGKTINPSARWQLALAKIRNALEPATQSRGARLEDFCTRVRRLIEWWQHASERNAAAFASAIVDDLKVATRWAEVSFDLTLDQIDSRVGRRFQRHPTLAHVLLPSWRRARDVAERSLPRFVQSFNDTIRLISLVPADIDAFLGFLEQQQLWAWHLEFAEVTEGGPSDIALDHRFLHLRSLAILFQPILAALAEEHGTSADKANVARSGIKIPMQAFLFGRPDRREQLWLQVNGLWTLTATTSGMQLANRLEQIGAVTCAPDLVGDVRTLLTLVALRNFGSHRFSNDPTLLTGYWPQLLHAAVFTPLFYWKVATSLR